jgi:hypothetical protein
MGTRNVLLISLLIGSFVLAGCTGTERTDSTQIETTPIETTPIQSTAGNETTATTRPGQSTLSYSDCPYYLAVEPAGEQTLARIDETVAYRDLPTERKREFEAALRNGSHKLGPDLPATWSSPKIVQYRSDPYYSVTHVC